MYIRNILRTLNSERNSECNVWVKRIAHNYIVVNVDSAAGNLRNGRGVNFMAVLRAWNARVIYNFNNRGAGASPRGTTLLIPPYVTTICLSNGSNEWEKKFQRNSAGTPASSAETCVHTL